MTVTTIPATLTKFSSKPLEIKKRRVAGYARVSSDKDEQFASYEAQVEYYTNYIKSHPDWEFVNVFTDEGISGTHTANRTGFNTMVSLALAGQIDLIITKSVSRFARNTVDSLTTIRKLKENGVECYFEKENIWTFDSKGEVLLTIMSSLAQEEARSISENVTWGWRKRFADGRVAMSYPNFLGYEKGPDGKPAINEEEAKIVRYIFKSFLDGKTPHAIAKDLTDQGYKTVTGSSKWKGGTISGILKNEKYAGDAILQKTYKPDLLSKRKANNGEVQKYYVTDSHPAIISKEVFEMVQEEFNARKEFKGQYSSNTVFSSKVICGHCGRAYGSKVWHSNDKYRKVVWRCNGKYQNHCTTPTLSEDELKQAVVNALNRFTVNKDSVIQGIEEIQDELLSIDELKKQLAEAQAELEEITVLLNGAVSDIEALQERYSAASQKVDDLTKKLLDTRRRSRQMHKFIKEVKGLDKLVDTFDEDMWFGLIDHMTVYSKDKITITFKGGYEI